MKASLLLVSFLLLSGCNLESTPAAYVDPVSGETSEMDTTALVGWDIHQFSGSPDGFISVAQSGKPVVSVMADGSGRDITVHGVRPTDTVTLHATSAGAVEEIELFSGDTLYRVHKSGQDWVLTKHRK
jgi:hypothetical protein